MVKIINYEKFTSDLTKLVNIETFRPMEMLGDMIELPAYTVYRKYNLMVHHHNNKYYFNPKYIHLVNIDEPVSEIKNRFSICEFSEFKEELMQCNYKIPGVNNSLAKIEEIANYEISSTISEEHYYRLQALDLLDKIKVNFRQYGFVEGYGYKEVVIAARRLLYAIQNKAPKNTIHRLCRDLSIYYIKFVGMHNVYGTMRADEVDNEMMLLTYKNLLSVLK